MDEYLCNECLTEKEGECIDCDSPICIDHSSRCNSCFNLYCSNCLKDRGFCDACWDPLKVISELGDAVENQEPEGGGSIKA